MEASDAPAAAAAVPTVMIIRQAAPRLTHHRRACGLPMCFSLGSHETAISAEEVVTHRKVTWCGLPITSGAGYEVDRVPLQRVSLWSLARRRFLVCLPRHSFDLRVVPTGERLGPVQIGPTDDVPYLRDMRQHTATARGKPLSAEANAEFDWVPCCSCESLRVSVTPDGLLTTDHNMTSCNSSREVQNAWLEDMSYVRYTQGSWFQAACCTVKNRMEISFLGDRYLLEFPANAGDMASLHAAVLKGGLGRVPTAPFKTFEGHNGSISVGPEFTTVSAKRAPLGLACCAKSEVTTVRTQDISHLRATLPSWQNSFVRAVRDLQLVVFWRKLASCVTHDVPLLLVWPCACLSSCHISFILFFKALLSMLAFFHTFLCRKTSLVFGGPGPAKQVSFVPDAEPEKLLRKVTEVVAQAQAAGAGAFRTGFQPIPIPASAVGAAKALDIAIPSVGGEAAAHASVTINPVAAAAPTVTGADAV